MKHIIKNYQWNGFGFPIIFEKLPAIKVRGELIPDINFDELASPIIQFICIKQDFCFSGNQIKFIRHYLKMTLRDFANFIGVTHQSVMRWEEKAKASAHMGAHVEFVMKIKVLKALHSTSKIINKAVETIDSVDNVKSSSYRNSKPLRVPNNLHL